MVFSLLNYSAKLEGCHQVIQMTPIFNLAWIFPNLIRDLLQLENQIPFVVLQTLFDKSKSSGLVCTPADAAFLSDKNIIENYLGTDEEVAHFFKNLGKDVPFDIDESYLSVAAVVLLLLTAIQAFFSVYDYFNSLAI
ncbi:unnamed protein product [Prunus brigantina]